MIYVNGKAIDISKFPDGTSSFHLNPLEWLTAAHEVTWRYEGDHECMAVWHIVNHLRNFFDRGFIALTMPYVPNARMDRVKNTDEVFTLKWFAEFINKLPLDEVRILDPHSNVSAALINNVKVRSPMKFIEKTISKLDDNGLDVMLCYPDEGAAKRYSDMAQKDYTFCVKRRDWRTGNIQGTTLMDPEKVKDRNVLVVDDICSRGGTFMHTAKALKEAGAKQIYLYVTHCEHTIFEGDLLTSGLIEHVFTTNSIMFKDSDKITAYDI